MNCAYCGKGIERDLYEGSDGWDFHVKVGGIPVKVEFHRKCLPKFIGEALTEGLIHNGKSDTQMGERMRVYAVLEG